MQLDKILQAEYEAKRFLQKVRELKKSETNGYLFKKNDNPFTDRTYASKETGALKRSSLDLTRALAELRNKI